MISAKHRGWGLHMAWADGGVPKNVKSDPVRDLVNTGWTWNVGLKSWTKQEYHSTRILHAVKIQDFCTGLHTAFFRISMTSVEFDSYRRNIPRFRFDSTWHKLTSTSLHLHKHHHHDGRSSGSSRSPQEYITTNFAFDYEHKYHRFHRWSGLVSHL